MSLDWQSASFCFAVPFLSVPFSFKHFLCFLVPPFFFRLVGCHISTYFALLWLGGDEHHFLQTWQCTDSLCKSSLFRTPIFLFPQLHLSSFVALCVHPKCTLCIFPLVMAVSVIISYRGFKTLRHCNVCKHRFNSPPHFLYLNSWQNVSGFRRRFFLIYCRSRLVSILLSYAVVLLQFIRCHCI